MKFAIALAGMCAWIGVISLAAAHLSPYWALLFPENSFFITFAGIAVCAGAYILGSWALYEWGSACE